MDRKKSTSKVFLVFASAAFLLMTGIGGAFAETIQLTLTGVGAGTSYGGVYTGPYAITVGSQPMNLICDDYSTEISPVYTWTANVFTLSSITSGLKFGAQTSFGGDLAGASPYQAYEEVLYLAQQMMQAGNSTYTSAIHFAIWQIMDPALTTGVPQDGADTHSSTAYWLTQAAGNYAGVNAANFVIYTPLVLTPGPATAGSDISQEFILVKNPSPTPVPPSVLLLGTGLLGLAGFRRRPKK